MLGAACPAGRLSKMTDLASRRKMTCPFWAAAAFQNLEPAAGLLGHVSTPDHLGLKPRQAQQNRWLRTFSDLSSLAALRGYGRQSRTSPVTLIPLVQQPVPTFRLSLPRPRAFRQLVGVGCLV